MGCSRLSKHKKPGKRTSSLVEKEEPDCALSEEDLLRKFDEEAIAAIKKDLHENPELFVLNNILMCTMFLKNYKRESSEVYQQITKQQRASYWEPDIMMDRTNQNLIYRPLHGLKKNAPEHIVTRRIYVPMNDFVQVHDPLDDEDDDQGTTKYHVKIQESRRPGYVKLQRIKDDRTYEGSTKDLLSVPSSNSGHSDTDSTGTSVEISVKENSQLIKEQYENGDLEDCFVFRKMKKADIDLELEDLDCNNLTEDDIYDIVSYLPARKFMKYFQNKVFSEALVQQLGLVQYEVDKATVDEHLPGKIFCNLLDENGNKFPVEILPCLESSWPHKQTYKFFESQKVMGERDFIWHTDEMMEKLKNFHCVLVPKGYSRKRGEESYLEGDLDWEIHFPQAESYLQTLLRPEQLKCYLIMLALFKEYVEPYTKNHGIAPENFLTAIFWESEKDYDAWPCHRLGRRLLSLIDVFSSSLSKRVLGDYFIRNRNNLQSVPRKYLEVANEAFFRINQRPLTYILRCLRNIRVTSKSFYPPLNYKELMDILYKSDWEEQSFFNNRDAISVSITSKPMFTDAVKQLEYIKELEKKRKMIRKRDRKSFLKTSANLSYNLNMENRRSSIDSVKDEWECETRFCEPKAKAILRFFIKNLIDIAETSQEIGSSKQTGFYLKQAWYLTKIFEEKTELFPEEAVVFFKKIDKAGRKLTATMRAELDCGESQETGEDSEVGQFFSEENDTMYTEILGKYSTASY